MTRSRPSDARTILIVDDEVDLVDLLKYNLEQEGYSVVTATNGADALDIARRAAPDLIVLDVMMPGMDGIEVCRRIRKDAAIRTTPVIMLTARTEDEDYVRGLDVGADIYLGKPISLPVLISQVKALFRRSDQSDSRPDVLAVHGLEIDRDRYLVVRGAGEIRLPRKEFELLHYLASSPGKVFSRQDLLDAVWGHDVFVVDRTVDVHVRKIREKLGTDLIETVTGVGYKLRPV
jgi:two-component system alkaline phosphatase synthesis response regulator PhoP